MNDPRPRCEAPEPKNEVEALVSDDDRSWLEEIEEDPFLDRIPARRSQVDADRLLRILDELAAEGGDE